MNKLHLIPSKEVYLFELDDVLFPKRDYLLQIYYLFAQFIEFTEGKSLSRDIVQFMKGEFEQNGEKDIISKTLTKFGLKQEYRENFERLYANAHLPVKLELFPEILAFFEKLRKKDLGFALLTKGNPVAQLNKIKHMDFKGWQQYVKIYFVDELEFRNIDPFEYIATEINTVSSKLTHITDIELLKR